MSRKTALLYRSKVSAILKYADNEVTADKLRAFLKTIDNRGYANNYVKAAKKYFRDYMKQGEIVESFKFVSCDPPPSRLFTKAELREFYHALEKQRDRAVFLMFASSGRRQWHEVLDLRQPQVAASVGHDLRGPLQSIINSAYLIGAIVSDQQIPLEPSSEIRELLKIERQVTYMDGILNDIRDLARDLVPFANPVEISNLVDEALSMVRLPDKIRLSVNVDVKGPVSVDANMITRVLVNLITNAIQAMPGGGGLQISVHEFGDKISIEVKDTGIGVPEENLKRLFTPFFTTKPDGSGLDLAICKRIVEAHCGKISAESQVGKGTTFTVELPRNWHAPGSDGSAQQDDDDGSKQDHDC